MAIQDFLFGKTEYKPLRISDALQSSIDTTSGASMNRFRSKKGGILDAFQRTADRTLPKVEQAVNLGQGDLSAASGMLTGFNPVGTYERIRSGNLAGLTGLSDALAGIGRRSDQAMAARLGMAGRPSSARDLIRARGTASAFAPIANTIFGNLGSDTAGLGRQVVNQAGALRAIAAARPDLFGQIYQYALAPLSAEGAALSTETDALRALGDAVKANYAGMDAQKKMGLMDYPVRMSESLAGTVGNLADAAGSVMSIAGPVMGMGGGGGMLGGLFGGGGGAGSVSAPNLNWGSFQPSMAFGFPSYGGGYPNWFGGPRPMDVGQMNPLQMIMLENARRYGSQNVPAGSVWE